MTASRPRKRQRALKACKSCRHLKKKCDGEEPCSYCSRFQHECIYEQQADRETTGFSHTPNALVNPSTNAHTPMPHSEKEPVTEQNILDPENGRYFDSSSAIAFPRLLGMQLGANKAPRLHSFAWNLGLRSEPSLQGLDITQFISLDDVQTYSGRYFTLIHPTYNFLHQEEFNSRASMRWKSPVCESLQDFDALICSVVALGYFCSPQSDHDVEAALIAFAKDRLDGRGLFKPPSIDIIAAWILRAIYLRATSRPQGSWMASNIVMHLIVSAGLHHEISSVAIIYPSASETFTGESHVLYRRKIFWFGRAIHNLFSYEFSRPRMEIGAVTCEPVDLVVSDTARELLQLASNLPKSTENSKDELSLEESKLMIRSLAVSNITSLPISLFTADVAFAAYRHIRSHTKPFVPRSDWVTTNLMAIGHTALRTIQRRLLDENPRTPSEISPSIAPWWSFIFTPFHYILILLSIDTAESLSCIPYALQVLQGVAAAFNTHLTREAVQNAAMLIRLSQNRKEGDAKFLRQALAPFQSLPRSSMPDLGIASHGLAQEPTSQFVLNGQSAGNGKNKGLINNQTVRSSGDITRTMNESESDLMGSGFVDDVDYNSIITDWDDIFQNLEWM